MMERAGKSLPLVLFVIKMGVRIRYFRFDIEGIIVRESKWRRWEW